MGADYIGMTVLGAVNAAVGRQNIHRDLQYDHQVKSCLQIACLPSGIVSAL